MSRWIQDGRLLGSVIGISFIDFVHIFSIFPMKFSHEPARLYKPKFILYE